jgi:succinate dehydrogenase / fumarate reductase membrane anchor subunit
MVTNVTSFGRSGLSDWLVQRVSAVVILLYVICHAAIIINTPDMDYLQWRTLFADPVMKIFSLITLVALCAHAWIGMWTVATDYLTTRMLGEKATFVRFLFLVICIGILVVYLLWGIMILWSV